MILIGNQRGGGLDLANHLLKDENDHVMVHEVSGFACDDIHGAFKEAYAISKGTKCQQYLFSLSLNPPADKDVSIEQFE
ncbi:MAG: relaxase, partial [Pseudomonadota bacterium]